MAEQAKEHTRIEAPVEECFDTLTDFESYPEWAGDLKEARIVERDDEGRAAGRRVPRRGDGAQHHLPPALRLLRCAEPPRLACSTTGDIQRELDGAYELTRGRRRRRRHRRQLRAVDRPDHAHSGVREAPGRGTHHEDRARRAEGSRRARAHRGPTLTAGRRGRARPALHRQGRRRQDHRRGGHRAALRRRGALRTLVLSTDPAHSLGDAFDVWLGPRPPSSPSTLFGPAARRAGAHGGALGRDPGLPGRGVRLGRRRGHRGRGAVGAARARRAVQPGRHQDATPSRANGMCVVVDCAPTAETIRLLSLPDILEWYMERIFPMSRRLNRVLGPVLQRVSSLPMAGDDVFGAEPPLLRPPRRRARRSSPIPSAAASGWW